jgi:hypothetical protein
VPQSAGTCFMFVFNLLLNYVIEVELEDSDVYDVKWSWPVLKNRSSTYHDGLWEDNKVPELGNKPSCPVVELGYIPNTDWALLI